ncbi:hypothetical protein ACWHA1_25960 [Streptomyces decoyicus]
MNRPVNDQAGAALDGTRHGACRGTRPGTRHGACRGTRPGTRPGARPGTRPGARHGAARPAQGRP